MSVRLAFDRKQSIILAVLKWEVKKKKERKKEKKLLRRLSNFTRLTGLAGALPVDFPLRLHGPLRQAFYVIPDICHTTACFTPVTASIQIFLL